MTSNRLVAALVEDVKSAVADLNADSSQYHGRALIRTIFTFCDGLAAVIRTHALDRHASGYATFSDQDLAWLRVERKFESTHQELKKSLRLLMHDDGQSTIDFTSQGWQALVTVAPVRNRIVHPKSAEDLDVTTAEVVLAREVATWVGDTYLGAIRRRLEIIDQRRSEEEARYAQERLKLERARQMAKDVHEARLAQIREQFGRDLG